MSEFWFQHARAREQLAFWWVREAGAGSRPPGLPTRHAPPRSRKAGFNCHVLIERRRRCSMMATLTIVIPKVATRIYEHVLMFISSSEPEGNADRCIQIPKATRKCQRTLPTVRFTNVPCPFYSSMMRLASTISCNKRRWKVDGRRHVELCVFLGIPIMI